MKKFSHRGENLMKWLYVLSEPALEESKCPIVRAKAMLFMMKSQKKMENKPLRVERKAYLRSQKHVTIELCNSFKKARAARRSIAGA